MDGVTVTINIPASAWESFVKVADERQQTVEELLISLIQEFTRAEGDEVDARSYAQLTRRYLQGTLKRTASVNAFRLSEKAAAAVQASYGTSDPVEIIEQARARR